LANRVYGTSTVKEAIELYETVTNRALQAEAFKLCRPYKYLLLFEATSSHRGYSVAADKIHPTNPGHQAIFDLVRPVFDEMVEITKTGL